MHFHLYILQSEKSARLYIGQTADLARRLVEHQEGVTPSTRGRGPWRLLFLKSFDSRKDAMSLERQLKNWKNPAKVIIWIERQK